MEQKGLKEWYMGEGSTQKNIKRDSTINYLKKSGENSCGHYIVIVQRGVYILGSTL